MNASPAFADPALLMRRVGALLDAKRPGAARPLLAAVRRLAPPSAELAHLSARLAMSEDRLADAAAELDAAVDAEPEDAGVRKLRTELRLRARDSAGAAADAAEAVVLDGADPAAKALLGVVLLEAGEAADAVACLREAVAAAPANPAFLQGLAAAEEAAGDRAGAAITLRAGIAACPGATALRNALALLLLQNGDADGAAACADEARLAGVADACTFGLKGHALSSSGRHEEAATAYKDALALAPEDPYVRHLVAASGLLPGAPRAPEPYLRAVFDGYAHRFEAHILSLGYRVPGLIRGALERHRPGLDGTASPGGVLDLGCGTGLLAVACSDLPLGPWEGVDASGRMLAEAAGKDLYAALHEADLAPWLARDERRWPLVLAGDVLCYFGALDALFASVRGRLADGGLFVFSIEELSRGSGGTGAGGSAPRESGSGEDGPGWALRRQGRYAHEPRYLQAAASGAGLRVRELDRQDLRQEGGIPVRGLIAVLEHER